MKQVKLAGKNYPGNKEQDKGYDSQHVILFHGVGWWFRTMDTKSSIYNILDESTGLEERNNFELKEKKQEPERQVGVRNEPQQIWSCFNKERKRTIDSPSAQKCRR
jgi:hypothetical protein